MSGRPDRRLLEEAAEWALVFRYEAADAQTDAFERWRSQSPDHARAWDQAQGVFQALESVPQDIGKRVLGARTGPSRRALLGRLAVGATAVPLGAWVWRDRPWRPWMADHSTQVGERRVVALPDTSELVLNTLSAVNVAFDDHMRRLHLIEGEILVTTHPDPLARPRPFVADMSAGQVEALGTRFALRQLPGGRFRVSVYEHAVRIRSLQGGSLILDAGEQTEFDATGIDAATPIGDSGALWAQGMLLAQDMRLGDVIAELARYRHGVLQCDPEVAEQPVSGAISLNDTDNALDLIARTLPVRVVRRTPLWVRVTALD